MSSSSPGPAEDPQTGRAPADPSYAPNPGERDPDEPQRVLEPDEPQDAPD